MVIASIKSLYVMLFCLFYLAWSMFNFSRSFFKMARYSLFSATAKNFFDHCLRLFFLLLKMITLINFSLISSIWFWWLSSKAFLPHYSVMKGSDELCALKTWKLITSRSGGLLNCFFFILLWFIHFTIRLRIKYSFYHVQLCTISHIIITWIIMIVLA